MRPRGHIEQRGPKVFRIHVPNGYDANGKRLTETRTFHGTAREAEQEKTRILRDLDSGRLGEGRQTLTRFLNDEWLPTVATVSKRGRPLAPTTLDRYRGAVGHITRHIGDVRVMDIRVPTIVKLRDGLVSEGTRAAGTNADVIRVLSQALNYAEALGYVGRNPAEARLVNRPVGKKPVFVAIDPERGLALLDAVNGAEPWDVAVHLALGLGLRREEVLGLTWDDVDGDWVHIRHTVTFAAGKPHHGPPKSDAGERDIPIPTFVQRALKRHKAAQAERLLAVGITPTYIADNGAGDFRSPPTFSKQWARFAEANGFEGVTFHTLRHGTATLLHALGVPETTIIRILGQADTTILRRYVETLDSEKLAAADLMDGLLGSDR